jgi:hypothetical protein
MAEEKGFTMIARKRDAEIETWPTREEDGANSAPVVPENLIRADSRNEVESEHHST